MLKFLLLSLFVFFIKINSFASSLSQSSDTTNNVRKKIVYISIGINGTDFIRNSNFSINDIRPIAFSQKKINVGLNLMLINKKHFSTSFNIKYTQKGASEYFTSDKNILIKSETNLNYLQVELIPIIVKKQIFKFQPYFSLGGYTSFLISKKSIIYESNSSKVDINVQNLINKSDYGLIANIGCYIYKIPIEFQYERGIKTNMLQKQIYNNSTSLNIKF